MNFIKLNIQMFAADGKVVIETDLDSKGFKSGLDKMQSIAKTGFKAIATSVGVASAAVTGLIGYGVKYNAQIEQYNVALTTLTGSAEKANQIIEQIKKDAASTPFDVASLVQANQLLISTGMDASSAREDILALGNAISATGGGSDELSRMAVNLQQIKNVGKASALDIKQFAYAGIDVYGLLADYTGKSREEVTELEVSYNDLVGALKLASQEGGKYYNAMEDQSKTLNGQISNLQDNLNAFAGTIAEDATSAITNDFLPAINDTIQAMQEGFSKDGLQGLAEAFSDGFSNILMMLVEKAPDVVNVSVSIIENLIKGFKDNQQLILDSAFEIITILIDGIVTMLPDLLEMGAELIIQLMLGLAEKAPDLVPKIVEIIIKMLEVFNENFDKFVLAGIQLILGLIEGLIKSIPTIIENLPTIILAILNFFTASKLVSAGLNLIKGIGTGLINGVPELLKNIPKIIGQMVTSFKNNGLGAFKDIGVNLVKGLWNGINSVKDWILDKISGFGKSILNGLKSFFGIKSPSRLMRDEVGKYIAQGVGVGFEDELDSVYDSMQRAIDLETEKMSANVQTGSVYNKIMNTTPVQVNGTYTSTLEVDGEVLATVVNDVNDKKDLQYMF